jgi:hypothetical protein
LSMLVDEREAAVASDPVRDYRMFVSRVRAWAL